MAMSTTSINYQCIICGKSRECRPIGRIKGGYKAIRCGNCKLVSVYPLPSQEEISLYYRKYLLNEIDDYNEKLLIERHDGILRYLLSKIRKKQNPAFLDYGFGSGTFVKLVAKRGFRVCGIELDERNCKQLNEYCKKNDLNIPAFNISEGVSKAISQDSFDCITMFQTLEHTPNPLSLLISLSSLQKSGSLLYIECPNNDALYLKVKNIIRKLIDREGFFDSLNPPHHLYGFNRHSIKSLLKKTGYTPIEVNDFYFNDGMHQVKNMLWYPSFSDLLYKKNCRTPYHLAMFFIKTLDPLASRIFGAGGGLYALARKN